MTDFTTDPDAPDVIDVENTAQEAPGAHDDAEQASDAPESTETAESAQDEATEDDSKPGREAARYRRQLRETQTELQAAQDAATAAQRALVDHLAQTVGRVKPEAFWASGAELVDLLDDAGNVDVGKVTEAADKAATTLGLVRTPRPDPSQGRPPVEFAWKDEWTGAFSPSR